MNNDFYISTDKNLLDVDFIHDYISKVSYWGMGRTIEETTKTIANSFCFGVYSKSNEQIGFARVVTDDVFFGYVMDFIIAESHQGKGVGKTLMEFIMENKTIMKLQTIALKTKDAHLFYEKYGFKKVGGSSLWMSIDRQKLL